MKPFPLLFTLCSAMIASPVSASPFLVRNGQAEAEILVPNDASRTTLLAAEELSRGIFRMSGVKLEVLNAPSSAHPVKIHVGFSPRTDALGISRELPRNGAYLIRTGKNWMVLAGDDTEFQPVEPWPRSHQQIVNGSIQAEWEALTGKQWGHPTSQLRKYRTGPTEREASTTEPRRDTEGRIQIWDFDERGSFNAVCDFLRSLGMRWYMPGEIGEIAPHHSSIALPHRDEKILPDFDLRRMNFRFGTLPRETTEWAMRLGLRDAYGFMVAHGMQTMTQTPAILKEHPEWFALYGTQRQNQEGQRLNHLCYSNEELFRETVAWARALYDHYGYQAVSVMPPDAYISICQCPLCEGQDDPERGSRGKLSNHVWSFVNRVARELRKTHPDRLVVCCAYGANTLPPTRIEKLEPNVQVILVGGRRPRNNLPEQQVEVRALRESWTRHTERPLMIFENYPFTSRGFYLPAFTAQSLTSSIKETKGQSVGEDIWLSIGADFQESGLGLNHFMVYFTSRMYWGGPQQDGMAMLQEYCERFYGPAGPIMLRFFHHCEAHWQAMEKEKDKVDTALAIFEEARAAVASDSVEARRIAIVGDFLGPLRSKSAQLGLKRGPVPFLRTVWEIQDPLKIDGQLDEPYWKDCPQAAKGRLSEIQTGGLPTFGTSVMAGWDRSGQNLYLGIRCEERPGDPIRDTSRAVDDAAIWYGDAVEILLETDSHAYYQLAISPSGILVDLDRGSDKASWYRWQSNAEVATRIEPDHWTVEIRIPVTSDDNDPLNLVVGRKPSSSLPWYLNICRQRIRDTGSEFSALSPTGTPGFHVPLQFARFYDGRSHAFEADPNVRTAVSDRRSALELLRKRNTSEALQSFLALADRPGLSDFQRSDTLSLAAQCARSLGNFVLAEELAQRIPLEPVAGLVRMKNLIHQKDWAGVSASFGETRFEDWPFWMAGEAHGLRGRCLMELGMGTEAEKDFQAALPLLPDSKDWMTTLLNRARNQERNLKDPKGALACYLEIVDRQSNTGSSDYYQSVLAAARLLTGEGRHQEALKTISITQPEQMRGTWKFQLLLARAEALTRARQPQEARTLLQSLLNDPSIPPNLQKQAEHQLALPPDQ